MKNAVLLVRNFIIAVFTTYILASILHSQFVLMSLTDIGIEIGIGDWIKMTLADLSGLMVGYGGIISVALLLGFLIISAVHRWVTPLPSWRFALAGAIAMATALLTMYAVFNMTLIAGARDTVGIIAQCFAGAVGGWVYYKAQQS